MISIFDNFLGNFEMWRALRGGTWWYARFYKRHGHYYKWVNDYDKAKIYSAVERYEP